MSSKRAPAKKTPAKKPAPTPIKSRPLKKGETIPFTVEEKKPEVKTTTTKSTMACVCADHEMHTCIEVSRIDGVVQYIPLDTAGLEMYETSDKSFDAKYFRRLKDCPPAQAGKLYAAFARELGASSEVMAFLATLAPLSQQEIHMATARKHSNTELKDNKKTKATGKPEKAAAGSKKVVDKTTKAPKTPKADGPKKESAASMFQSLIMEGELTDDKIFEKVQAKFGLDDSKRGYVQWYRNNLKKKGMNPPAAKVK